LTFATIAIFMLAKAIGVAVSFLIAAANEVIVAFDTDEVSPICLGLESVTVLL
jgi:hypothetical protein